MTYTDKGATLSPCATYRYRLWRSWCGPLDRERTCLFVMLNPSTADALEDDPTIRRCVDFANRAGFNRLEVVNLFAYRTPSPAALKTFDGDAVGPANYLSVRTSARDAGLIVCAWGADGGYQDQDEVVMNGLKERGISAPIVCLGKTARGYPRHPLYIKGDTALIAFP